jgi:hypothetical protein
MNLKHQKKIYYISELNLISKSAYSIHVLKMCGAISKLGYQLELITTSNESSSKIFDFYNIRNKFRVNSVFKKKLSLNFFLRILMSIKILYRTHNEDCLYITRSIIFGLVSSALKKKTILELHHEITGCSKFLYNLLKTLRKLNNLNYIFLHKNLSKVYNIRKENVIVLDDAVNINDFRNHVNKKFDNTCVYVGSFFEGKGFEQILRLAKKNKKINFHVYGEKIFYENNYSPIDNLKIFNHKPYKLIPKILSKYHVALMPYQKKIRGRSNIQIEKYISPLKMFDYMASKLIIVASDLKIYKHILVDNHNCKLVKLNNDKAWGETLNNIFINFNKYKYLKINAFRTAKIYTWENRVRLIFKKFKI